ncbi:hypothetical protein AQ611_23395 [Burkholderia singularis]|nr:hypothetical protein AQ611_23395 [Burkholderia sp. Bp7605]
MYVMKAISCFFVILAAATCAQPVPGFAQTGAGGVVEEAWGTAAASGSAQTSTFEGRPASTSMPTADAAMRKQRKAEDRRLRRHVSAALAHTRGLNSTRLIVRTHDGDVTLLGTLTDANQVELAVQAAQRVDGVKRVRNAIRVGEPGL